jgi:hypothetical protein
MHTYPGSNKKDAKDYMRCHHKLNGTTYIWMGVSVEK